VLAEITRTKKKKKDFGTERANSPLKAPAPRSVGIPQNLLNPIYL